MPMTDYCVWQVDDLQLSTSPPRRDPSLSDSSWALTPLHNGGQLWLVTRVEEYCFATASLLRTRAKARTQTQKKNDSRATTVVDGRMFLYPKPGV